MRSRGINSAVEPEITAGFLPMKSVKSSYLENKAKLEATGIPPPNPVSFSLK